MEGGSLAVFVVQDFFFELAVAGSEVLRDGRVRLRRCDSDRAARARWGRATCSCASTCRSFRHRRTSISPVGWSVVNSCARGGGSLANGFAASVRQSSKKARRNPLGGVWSTRNGGRGIFGGLVFGGGLSVRSAVGLPGGLRAGLHAGSMSSVGSVGLEALNGVLGLREADGFRLVLRGDGRLNGFRGRERGTRWAVATAVETLVAAAFGAVTAATAIAAGSLRPRLRSLRSPRSLRSLRSDGRCGVGVSASLRAAAAGEGFAGED